jgi:hypothetical protein
VRFAKETFGSSVSHVCPSVVKKLLDLDPFLSVLDPRLPGFCGRDPVWSFCATDLAFMSN